MYHPEPAAPVPGYRGQDRRRRRSYSGNQLRKIRLALGYTQAQFAALLHVIPRTVANWENGHCLPGNAALERLHEHLAQPRAQAVLFAAGIGRGPPPARTAARQL